MAAGRVHIVGAGLAGLACAVRLAGQGREVRLYEATASAGGRCRSWFDPTLGRTIDNGNHLLLSAYTATLAYLDAIGARDTLDGPPTAAFPFVDLRTGARWVLRPNRGPVPWWLFDPRRRVPGTTARAYLQGWRLALADDRDTVADRLGPAGPLWPTFWRPMTIAVLNTAPEEASARLLWSAFARTFARGATGSRPLVARESLSASFVEPALRFLHRHGAAVRFHQRLRAIRSDDGDDGGGGTRRRVRALAFSGGEVALDGDDDWVVLAVPPGAAAAVVPELDAPPDSRCIVNAHYRLGAASAAAARPAADTTPFLGVINGTAEWLFFRDDLVSVTVSAADALAERPSDEIAAVLWADIARALALDPATPVPPVRVIKERRATFAQTPDGVRRRPAARTAYRNLLLAGDWTATGLPATIEGAVRSGWTAARLIVAGARDATRPSGRRALPYRRLFLGPSR